MAPIWPTGDSWIRLSFGGSGPSLSELSAFWTASWPLRTPLDSGLRYTLMAPEAGRIPPDSGVGGHRGATFIRTHRSSMVRKNLVRPLMFRLQHPTM